MAYSAEESSPVAYISEPCCICDEEFSSDLQLTNHLIEHTNEEGFKAILAEKEKSQSVPPTISTPTRPVAVVGGRQVIPEFTKTSFVREPPLKKKSVTVPPPTPVPPRVPAEPEVWEIVSDSDEEQQSDPKKAKLSNSFRLVTPGGSQTNSGAPYNCHSCSSVFDDSALFRDHLLTHDKPRPYVCHICKKSFAYKGTLRQHLHLHISEKAHECRVCHKKFSIKSLLRKHEETHEMQQFQEQRSS